MHLCIILFGDTMKLIDTHAHYNSKDLNNLNDEIININKNDNIDRIINVGLNYDTSKEVIDIGLNNNKFYSTIGIHPLKEGSIDLLNYLSSNYDISKVVAIGETGIDTNKNIDVQIKIFIDSIKLANKLKLPIIIHSNTTKYSLIYANRLCIEIIKRYYPNYGFVFHSFQPDLDILKEIINLGGFVSVEPMILKSNAKKSLEVVRNIDINNLLIENDYPYLSNDQINDLKNVFEKVCMLKGMNEYSMENHLNNNAKRLFYKLK